jgi:hypothetical protein
MARFVETDALIGFKWSRHIGDDGGRQRSGYYEQ